MRKGFACEEEQFKMSFEMCEVEGCRRCRWLTCSLSFTIEAAVVGAKFIIDFDAPELVASLPSHAMRRRISRFIFSQMLA